MPRRNTRLICDPQDNCRTIPASPKTDPPDELFILLAKQARGIELSQTQLRDLQVLAGRHGSGHIRQLRERARELWRRVDLAAELPAAEDDLTYQTDRHSRVSLAAAKRVIAAQQQVDECRAATQSVAELELQFTELFPGKTKCH